MPITVRDITFTQIISNLSNLLRTTLGIGGADGAITIDLEHLTQFSMDESTWVATIGSGHKLGDVTELLHDAGGRAIAHGTCPTVGIGGHATIGGLGPSSRMWGSTLDHVEEMEVVLADSSIVRASATENQDVFFAMKGAGASFGIITEFKFRTEAEPGEAVEYSFTFSVGPHAPMSQLLKDWQTFVADPELSRKLATTVTVAPASLIISGTFFGSRDEFDAIGFEETFANSEDSSVAIFDDWVGLVTHWAESLFLEITGAPIAFYSKTLAFDTSNLMENSTIDSVFEYFDSAEKDTILWFVIFDLAGGAVNDPATDATAYPHRDTLYFMQSYAVGVTGEVSDTTKNFLNGLNDVITSASPGEDYGAYAGYVDPLLPNGQGAYWGSNLPRLEQIKLAIDPNDVFHNPQSVKPASE